MVKTIYIGNKPAVYYVTEVLFELQDSLIVRLKGRARNITYAIDVAYTLLRVPGGGYSIGNVSIGSESVNLKYGKTRTFYTRKIVSTIEIDIKKDLVP